MIKIEITLKRYRKFKKKYKTRSLKITDNKILKTWKKEKERKKFKKKLNARKKGTNETGKNRKKNGKQINK